MERIMRLAVLYVIIVVTCGLAIVVSNGDLSWGLLWLVGLMLVLGFIGYGVWAVVHGQFESNVEYGLTAGILAGMVLAATILLMAGHEIKSAFSGLFQHGGGWWFVVAAAGTAVTSIVFGLHRRS